MNWQKSLKNVGTLVKKKNNYPYPAMPRNKVVGCPCNKMQSNSAPLSIS